LPSVSGTNSGRTPDTISIRPGVSILSLLQHVNYKPWFAMAEFVDNSLQSFLENRDQLERVAGRELRLTVTIEIDPVDRGRVTVRDNAAGIHEGDYPRAFRPAEVPPDRSGLSEFGMGMKSASCWFSRRWTVRTSALGEAVERTVSFDIDRIVRDDLEELEVQSRPASPDTHYTEIVLGDLHRPLQGRTIGKIKDHLGSIYRIFIRDGLLDLRFDRDQLLYPEPAVLVASYFKDPRDEPKRWQKPIDLDFGLGLRAHGFAALRSTGSTSDAGFALFRRNRLIQGSRDEGYRPEHIFGKSNSFTYQRLFGELHLEGFEVSHTKDGFRWDEHEEIVLELLKQQLNADPLQLLSQAEGYRTRVKTEDLRSGADVAVERTAETIQREAAPVLDHQLAHEPGPTDPKPSLEPVATASRRVIEVPLQGCRWIIELELSNDPSVGEWVSVYDQPARDTADGSVNARRLGIRLALAHPFTERFGGTEPAQIEPLLRLAAALVLAEITAREGGVRYAGRIRHYVNELLRDALSKP
jgi:hypothetical protein